MILLCKDDVGSIVESTSSLVWADVILADFQRVISHYLQDISTYLPCTAQRVLRTISMQKYKLKYACLPSKIVKIWMNRSCVHYDWWRRLQPTSSVSPVWFTYKQRTSAAVILRKQHGCHTICELSWCYRKQISSHRLLLYVEHLPHISWANYM